MIQLEKRRVAKNKVRWRGEGGNPGHDLGISTIVYISETKVRWRDGASEFSSVRHTYSQSRHSDIRTQYSAHNTVYTILFTQYSEHNTMYTKQCTQYCVQKQCTQYSIHLYTIHCTQYNVHKTLYTIQCTKNSVHNTVCTIQCAQSECTTQYSIHILADYTTMNNTVYTY